MEVPFDETIVKYYWVAERVFDIVDIELRSKNKTLLIEQAHLALDEDGEADAGAALALTEATDIEAGNAGNALPEGEEQVFEEGAY